MAATREEIKEATERFLKQGGKIQHLEPEGESPFYFETCIYESLLDSFSEGIVNPQKRKV